MKVKWIVCAGISIEALAGQSHITVEVKNAARITHYTVSRAEAVASSLFERAGIEIEWIECFSASIDPWQSSCLETTNTDQFTIVIRQNHGTARVHDTALGYSLPFSGMHNHAAVFWQSVSRTAQRNSDAVDERTLLGMVMAHELGHLLMGSGRHGPGVMNAGWRRSDFREMGQCRFRFTLEQAAQLRRGLENRNRTVLTGRVLLAGR
jgi:hypothetical protein